MNNSIINYNIDRKFRKFHNVLIISQLRVFLSSHIQYLHMNIFDLLLLLRVNYIISSTNAGSPTRNFNSIHNLTQQRQIWDASGQGRFCTIIRSYSRGAQGIILVYDITNKWSFEGINRWLKEVEEHAPGVPKVLVGNRLHLAFKRQVAAKSAESYASRHKMSCFEISPLCDFNIRESFCELARMALHRNGMERIWRTNRGK